MSTHYASFSGLPYELIEAIAQSALSYNDIINLCQTETYLRPLCQRNTFWRKLYLERYSYYPINNAALSYRAMFRQASQTYVVFLLETIQNPLSYSSQQQVLYQGLGRNFSLIEGVALAVKIIGVISDKNIFLLAYTPEGKVIPSDLLEEIAVQHYTQSENKALLESPSYALYSKRTRLGYLHHVIGEHLAVIKDVIKTVMGDFQLVLDKI